MPGSGCRTVKVSLAALVTSSTSYSLRRTQIANDHVVDTRHEVNGTHDVEAQLGNIWVPITLPQYGKRYLNPVTGERRAAPPVGAAVTRDAAVTGYGAQRNPEVSYGAPGEQLVPQDVRNSCVPHCTWNCTQPVCEQKCEPVCHSGECETRCPKMDKTQLEKCQVNCNEPKCSMFCPKDTMCDGKNKTLACPTCKTRCEEPQCNFVCNNNIGDCKNVCPDPVCTFKCQDPTSCPKPECKMICETPPDCSTHPTLPPAGDHLVVKSGKAQHGLAQWSTGVWGKCSTDCGTGVQQRSVTCSSGHDEDCMESKPLSEQKCDDFMGCQYATSEWGECSAKCGAGTRSRRVSCAGPRCLGAKPADKETCTNNDKECSECETVVFGGPAFDGWSLAFGPGDYTVSDMEVKGAKCDDISSVKVQGVFCEAHVFEYGDFNVQHQGWQAVLRNGDYDRKGLINAGAQDNDISSIKVIHNMPLNSTGSAFGAGKEGMFGKNGVLGPNMPLADGNPMNASWPNAQRPWGGAGSASVVMALMVALVAAW